MLTFAASAFRCAVGVVTGGPDRRCGSAQGFGNNAFTFGPAAPYGLLQAVALVVVLAGEFLDAGIELPQAADDVGFVPVFRGWFF